MKHHLYLIICWIVLIGSPAAYAQQVGDNDIIGKQVALDLLVDLNPAGPGGYSFDNRYAGVRGSRWMYPDWRPGKLRLAHKDTTIRVGSMNVDLHAQQVLVLLGNSNAAFIPTAQLQSAVINLDSTPMKLISLPAAAVGKKQEGQMLPVALHEGDHTLIRLDERRLMKADYEGAYSPDRRYDEWIAKSSYWIQAEDGFEKIKLQAKSLRKALPDQAQAIKKLVAEGYDPGTEKGMSDLLKALEK